MEAQRSRDGTRRSRACQLRANRGSARSDVFDVHARLDRRPRLAEIDYRGGHPTEAVERLEQALETLSTEEPDADVADVAGQLGRYLILNGGK